MVQMANKWVVRRHDRRVSCQAYDHRPTPTLFKVGSVIYVRDEDKLLEAVYERRTVRKRRYR